MPELANINALIFDLGGVIIDLDLEGTYRDFAYLSGKTLEEVKYLAAEQSFMKEYEAGKIDDPTFRAHIREMLGIYHSDEEIDAVWNVTIKSIKRERLALIEELGKTHQCFVMSNTNDIHLRQIMLIGDHVAPNGSFSALFKQMYFSQELGVMKPDTAAWQPILDDNELDPAATLFIDDKLENIEGAAKLGIQGYHNQHIDDWMGLFS